MLAFAISAAALAGVIAERGLVSLMPLLAIRVREVNVGSLFGSGRSGGISSFGSFLTVLTSTFVGAVGSDPVLPHDLRQSCVDFVSVMTGAGVNSLTVGACVVATVAGFVSLTAAFSVATGGMGIVSSGIAAGAIF